MLSSLLTHRQRIVVDADAGVFSLTGVAATLTDTAPILTADGAQFALSGSPVEFSKLFTLAGGTFSVTGSTTTLQHGGYVLAVRPGALSVGSGQVVSHLLAPTLLPPNSTHYENALASPLKRLTAIPTPVDTVFRYDQCQADLLPWLAWALSVDLWDYSWPEETKRAIIKESLELHRRKGTLKAIERYLSYAGAPLRRYILPPNKTFPGRAETPEERQEWLDRFPQVRVYRFRDRGQSTYGAFTRGAYKLPKTFFGTVYPYQTDAWERYGPRAFLWDRGTHRLATGKETPLRYVERVRDTVGGRVVDFSRSLIGGTKIKGLFPGTTLGNLSYTKRACVESAANTRIVTVERPDVWYAEQDRLIKITSIPPSLTPIKAFPDYRRLTGYVKLGQNIWAGHVGKWLNFETKTHHTIKGFLKGYLPETSAPLRLFSALYLHDKNRLPEQRVTNCFLGHTRLGMPPFHAVLYPVITGKRTSWQAGRYLYGHTCTSDLHALSLARQAVVLAKAKRDKVLLHTKQRQLITTTSNIKSGDGYHSGGSHFLR